LRQSTATSETNAKKYRSNRCVAFAVALCCRSFALRSAKTPSLNFAIHSRIWITLCFIRSMSPTARRLETAGRGSLNIEIIERVGTVNVAEGLGGRGNIANASLER
jgi:hypothetical protein